MKKKPGAEFETDVESDPLGVFKRFYFEVAKKRGLDSDTAKKVAERAALKTQVLIDEIADEENIFDFVENEEKMLELMRESLEEILNEQIM